MTTQFKSTQEAFDEMNLVPKRKFNQETFTDINCFCNKHRRQYDRQYVRSLSDNKDWLPCMGCPTCYTEERSLAATRYVERLNGNKPIQQIINPPKEQYDATSKKSRVIL